MEALETLKSVLNDLDENEALWVEPNLDALTNAIGRLFEAASNLVFDLENQYDD